MSSSHPYLSPIAKNAQQRSYSPNKVFNKKNSNYSLTVKNKNKNFEINNNNAYFSYTPNTKPMEICEQRIISDISECKRSKLKY